MTAPFRSLIIAKKEAECELTKYQFINIISTKGELFMPPRTFENLRDLVILSIIIGCVMNGIIIWKMPSSALKVVVVSGNLIVTGLLFATYRIIRNFVPIQIWPP